MVPTIAFVLIRLSSDYVLGDHLQFAAAFYVVACLKATWAAEGYSKVVGEVRFYSLN